MGQIQATGKLKAKCMKGQHVAGWQNPLVGEASVQADEGAVALVEATLRKPG